VAWNDTVLKAVTFGMTKFGKSIFIWTRHVMIERRLRYRATYRIDHESFRYFCQIAFAFRYRL
jgi:hypothetical protein